MELPSKLPDDDRAELDRLGERLAVRTSITHFAIGFVSTFLGIIAFGITLRLIIDAKKAGLWFVPVAALTCACVFLAVHGFAQGRRLAATERTDYRRYLELRARAGLD